MSNIIPIRIQRSRKTKQESPNGLPIVYVGRPGKWGNPFTLKEIKLLDFMAGRDGKVDDDKLREAIIRKFKSWLWNHPGYVNSVKKELKGKNLSCWCPLNKKCHADVLLEIANS